MWSSIGCEHVDRPRQRWPCTQPVPSTRLVRTRRVWTSSRQPTPKSPVRLSRLSYVRVDAERDTGDGHRDVLEAEREQADLLFARDLHRDLGAVALSARSMTVRRSVYWSFTRSVGSSRPSTPFTTGVAPVASGGEGVLGPRRCDTRART